ncbi:RNA-directed DNA polymerase [Agromyces arachidis]|uniref:RNA-directed DNA polymerase n=1 Tax=Agromyces arachidis TaxID=766966 RepID=UPI004055E82B
MGEQEGLLPDERTAIELIDVATFAGLKAVWKKHISPQLNDVKFSSRNLVVDPLHHVVLTRYLDDALGQLVRELNSGDYAPQRATLLRSAKGLGFTRPVCVLAPRDALVYRAIVAVAEPDLLNTRAEWASAARSGKGTADDRTLKDDDESESVDWFQRWLEHEGLLPRLSNREDVLLIVQSDISNFFPSVRLELVREHLTKTRLSTTLVQLCTQIVKTVVPREDYRDDARLGLPQEEHSSSRAIAQSVLAPVDMAFQEMGLDDRYSRYMDDVVWGVKDNEEAMRTLARFQNALETLGLYPNISKTTVSTKEQFFSDHLVETNARIQRIDAGLGELFSQTEQIAEPSSALIDEVKEVSIAHRNMEQRPLRWNRVTRRLYTLHRRLGIDDWDQYWTRDLQGDPAGAHVYFEYFRASPLSDARLKSAIDVVGTFHGLYEDLSIMVAEAIATAPVASDGALWERIFEVAKGEFLSRAERRDAPSQQIASSWFMLAAKYGTAGQCMDLVDSAIRSCGDRNPMVVLQAVALDSSRLLRDALRPDLFGADEALASEYLESLKRSDTKSVAVARALIQPRKLLQPARYLVKPRAFLLMSRLGTLAEGLPPAFVATALSNLSSNSSRLRDHRSEQLFSQWRR